MATTKKNIKTKKILTEDAFNANGNATVTEKALNENVEKINEKEDTSENMVMDNVEDKIENEKETAKIEEDLSNVNVTRPLHISSNKKIINNGFNDETFYR